MAFFRRNPNLFTTTNAGKKEVDLELNEAVYRDNRLLAKIEDVESEGISGVTDANNVGKLPSTDGENVTWVKLVLDYFQPKSVDDSIFQDSSLTQRVMGAGSIGTPQIIDLNVTTEKIANDGVTPSKIPKGSIPFSKWVKPQTASTICGSTDKDGYWYEQEVKDNQVISKKAGELGTKAMDLKDVFNNTEGSPFDGAKIKTGSIDGASAMKSNSTPLATLKSAGTTISVVCGKPKVEGENNGVVKEVTLKPLQVISLRSNGTEAESMKVSDLINNEGGAPLKGSKVAEGSMPSTALEDMGQNVPFAMGYILSDGTIKKSKNIAKNL